LPICDLKPRSSCKVFPVGHKGYEAILQIENRQSQIENASAADR